MEKLKELLPWIACLLLDIAVGMVIWYCGYKYGKHSVVKENLTTENTMKDYIKAHN